MTRELANLPINDRLLVLRDLVTLLDIVARRPGNDTLLSDTRGKLIDLLNTI